MLYAKKKNKKGAENPSHEKGNLVGRKRKDPDELDKTICLNLKQKILNEIEKEGNPKHVLEELITKM
ncbi:hypothetical protein, partial [Paenibacillus macerans]|uniref:hypothetical protein n=1 Tax=Paenibacillus macerans TaxID=44252 RepID=UPI001D131AC2